MQGSFQQWGRWVRQFGIYLIIFPNTHTHTHTHMHAHALADIFCFVGFRDRNGKLTPDEIMQALIQAGRAWVFNMLQGRA